MGPIIWYTEPRCASMDKRPASMPVANVSKAVLDRQFPQRQILTQIQTFRDKVTPLNLCQVHLEHQLTDLQHSLADLAILSARQEQLQLSCLAELRSLKTQPITLPLPTWSTSPPQPLATFPPSRTPFAAGPSSPSPTTPPCHSSSHPVCHFPTSRYLPQSSSGSVFHPIDSDPHSSYHYPPPPPTHGPHFTHAYSPPPNSPITIPAPDLQGPPTSTPVVLEFTTASLEPVLHRTRLDTQVQRVTESVSSLRVCHDRLQTQPTEGEDGIKSQLEGLDSTLRLNPSRALELTPSNPYPRPFICSPPLTSIPHLESVTQAPCSLSTVLIPSILSNIGSSPTVPMSYLQTAPHLPSRIPSSAPPQLRHHRVPPLLSTSPLLTAMTTLSGTRASVTVEGSRTTTRPGHASTQIKRFLQPISSVEMKRKPPSEVLGYRQSKNSSNFSFSSVGSTLRSYCCTDGLVNTVLINDVTASRLKGGSPTSCTGSRVVPPLGTPIPALEDFSPKEDFIQIAHRVPRPKEPDKALFCQVPLLRSPLKNAWLHLEFRTHHMTVEMIVSHSCGSRRNIIAVFGKKLKREMAQTYVPDLLLDPHLWMAITTSVPDFLLVEIGECCTMDVFLCAIEFFGIGNKVYPAFSLHCPAWCFLTNYFLTRNAQSATETILVSSTTLLTGTFGWVSSCSMDTFLRMIVKAPKWECTGRGSMNCSTIWHTNLTLMANGIFYPFMRGLTKVISTLTLSRHMIDTMTSVCLLVSHCNTCVTRTFIRLLEKSANLKWPTDGHFRQEEDVFAVLIRGHIPDPLQITAESLSLNFQKLISMVLSLAVGTEQIGCSSFSPNLVAIENFYWMIILPKLQSPHATEHPTLMDNALKIFIAIGNATLETMILQFSLTLLHFLSAESTVVHSFAINDLDQSPTSKHNILLEQFGARKARLGLAYFNFHDHGITALVQFNLAISFLSSYFPYVHRWPILLWSLSASYTLYLLGMFKAVMSYTGTWCFELIIKLVRSVRVQLDHTLYNHAILGLWTATSLEQTCTVMYGVLSHFGNVHNIKTWANLFADDSVNELLRLTELIQYCVDDANLSAVSLLTPRMQDYYLINTTIDDTYLQNVSRYTLKIILGLCSVASYPATEVKFARIESSSCMVESTTWQAWSTICLAANFLLICLEIHTALVLEASIMTLFLDPKAWENKQRKPLHANLTA